MKTDRQKQITEIIQFENKNIFFDCFDEDYPEIIWFRNRVNFPQLSADDSYIKYVCKNAKKAHKLGMKRDVFGHGKDGEQFKLICWYE